jgi:6-pyruvoyltetrahydropterin/6-carboxytetrahydropterin synthase
MGRMLITRRADFSASHSCYNTKLSEEENLQLYGETAGSYGHGHNYVLEVTLEGTPDPETGMIYDLKELKDVMNELVVDPMDHRFLNREVPPFDTITPTTENIAAEIWRRLEPRLRFPNGKLHSIRLYETDDVFVEYSA